MMARYIMSVLFNHPYTIDGDDLRLSHFDKNPIWLDVHLNDFGDPAYEFKSETAVRPWDGTYPAHSQFTGMVLATFTTRNGQIFQGVIHHTDSSFNEERSEHDVLQFQPWIFHGDSDRLGFWGGAVHIIGDRSLKENMAAFYRGTGLNADEAFPIEFVVSPDVLSEPVKGTIHGFGFYSAENVVSSVRWRVQKGVGSLFLSCCMLHT